MNETANSLIERLWASDAASALTNEAARRIEELESVLGLNLTADEVDLIRRNREAHAAHHADQVRLYETVKRQSLADGMVEVEPGHFVKPGESWSGDDGTFHPTTP
jgi:hypothetical protein